MSIQRVTLRAASVAAFFLLSTSLSHAASQVLISEIHYNPVGTDDKHEYIEVCNVGADSVDIAAYKLFESSSNHTLNKNRGTSFLTTGACAVFVTDPGTFMADYPSFGGNLFDTSFSLSNTGEALVLRDANGADVDGVSYASSMGGNGDGNSLHRVGTSFSGGAPTPGSEAGLVGTGATGTTSGTGTTNGTTTGSTTDTNTNTGTTGSSSVTVFHTVTIEPPAQLFIRTKEKVESATHAVVTFTAETYNAKGEREDASCAWVYGDGMRDAGTPQTGATRTHTYAHAGEYEAVVTCTKLGLTAEERVRIQVVDSELRIGFEDEEQGVYVENTGQKPVDMTGMRIANSFQSYMMPEKTRILPQQKLHFVLNDIGLSDSRRPREVSLVYAGGKKLSVVGEQAVSSMSSDERRAVPALAYGIIPRPMTLGGYGAVQGAGNTPVAGAHDAQEDVQKVTTAHNEDQHEEDQHKKTAHTRQTTPHSTVAKTAVHSAAPVVSTARQEVSRTSEQKSVPATTQTAAAADAVSQGELSSALSSFLGWFTGK